MSQMRGRRARGEGLPPLVPVDLRERLDGVLAVDPARLDRRSADDRTRLIGRVADLDALLAALHGEVNRTIATLTPHKERGYREEQAVHDDIAAVRRMGSWTAARAVETARLCAGPQAPAAPLQAALLAGAVSAAHVNEFVGRTTMVQDDVLSPDEREQGVVGRTRAQKLAEIAAGTLRSARLDIAPVYRGNVVAGVARVDAAAEAERRAAAMQRRDVYAGAVDENGLSPLVLLHSGSVNQRFYGAIAERGRRLQLSRGGARAARTNPDAAIGACRADAFAAMIDEMIAGDPVEADGDADLPPADTGRASMTPPRIGYLVMTLEALRGEQDHPALLDGTPVPAQLGREAAAAVRVWHRMVTDPVTGHLLDYGRSVYLPEKLRRFVMARDGRCVVPHCDRSARNCQMDHGLSYPEGVSSAVNCAALCDRHHPLKTGKYVHLYVDDVTGWMTYETAWGQVLAVTGHSYLPDWDELAAASAAADAARDPDPPDPPPAVPTDRPPF